MKNIKKYISFYLFDLYDKLNNFLLNKSVDYLFENNQYHMLLTKEIKNINIVLFNIYDIKEYLLIKIKPLIYKYYELSKDESEIYKFNDVITILTDYINYVNSLNDEFNKIKNNIKIKNDLININLIEIHNYNLLLSIIRQNNLYDDVIILENFIKKITQYNSTILQ